VNVKKPRIIVPASMTLRGSRLFPSTVSAKRVTPNIVE
jgi:hypothetical protein